MASANKFQTTLPIHRISLTAPYSLDAALAYSGDSRWLGLYWESELNQLCHTDGQSVSTGNSRAWQIFYSHPDIKPLLEVWQLGDEGQPAQNYLLLDRQTRRLYVGESTIVEDCLAQPQLLDLLAELETGEIKMNAPVDSPSWLQWGTDRATIICGVLLVLLGLPIAGWGVAELLDHEYWLEIELPEWLEVE
ncbi:hypothetical protein [Thermocoleostomius sinensis]|uniref:Uncharacterized protein n=1 Tax=Thermocoleostomius sinensis A174 TaxID=2016057 RepID=A0A9E8ZBL8_9CYAN|nr:hypothetical protein [Thermocoleostomius sinensis]WAL59856.1 hypothetical protein OXH18_22220 [Thermocoleostomius sinensis A174]